MSRFVDSFGRVHDYLRVSLTEKCNLKCGYCVPKDGKNSSHCQTLLTNDEVVKICGFFVRHGMRKIKFTGGEPTLRKGLGEIIGDVNKLRPLGLENISLTSNGIVLHRCLEELKTRGLDRVNISLDTLNEHKFEKMTKINGFGNVIKSVSKACSLNFQSLKLNCVVIRGFNDEEVGDFVQLTQDLDIEVRFIEFMPFYGNSWDKDQLVSGNEMLDAISRRFPNVSQLVSDPSSTSKMFRASGHAGKFGFITSVSNHFCQGCNRLRLSAVGDLQMCLFAKPSLPLKDKMSLGCSDEELYDYVQTELQRKKFKHNGLDFTRENPRVDVSIRMSGG